MNDRVLWLTAITGSSLDSTAKHVALQLAMFMNGKGVCWPSKARLVDTTGYGDRTVDRAIRRLEQAGYLIVNRTRGRTTNRYRALNPVTQAGVNPVTQAGVELSPTPSLTTPNPVTDDIQPRHSDTPNLKEELERELAQPDRSRDQTINPVDQAALELAHGWLARHSLQP
jgi:DNA-binding transcriptional MocR family regulator